MGLPAPDRAAARAGCLSLPRVREGTRASSQEGQVALLSSAKTEGALDRLCGFPQNSCDWNLARILKNLYSAKRRGLVI